MLQQGKKSDSFKYPKYPYEILYKQEVIVKAIYATVVAMQSNF